MEGTSESTSAFCNRCGAQLPPDSSFCPRCGNPVECERSTAIGQPRAPDVASPSQHTLPRGLRYLAHGERRYLAWGAIAGALVMVVGGFGPWAYVFGVFSVSGTRAGDGWIVVGTGIAAAATILLYLGRSGRRVMFALLAMIAGMVGGGTAIYDLVRLRRVAVSHSSLFGSVQVVTAGWGIYACVVGAAGVIAGVAALLLTTRRSRTKGEDATRVAVSGPSVGDAGSKQAARPIAEDSMLKESNLSRRPGTRTRRLVLGLVVLLLLLVAGIAVALIARRTNHKKASPTTATSSVQPTAPTTSPPITASTSAAPISPPAQVTSPQTSSSLQQAIAIVKSKGFVVPTTEMYGSDGELHVLIGVVPNTADSPPTQAFFFYGNRYLGTDALKPSAEVSVPWRDSNTVALSYVLFKPADPQCCPTGGSTTVRFRWDGQRLVALEPIPSDDVNAPLSRR
jgi:RNA polymerase subunit RPABC4/transcription elongation factor Spt4